MELITIVSTFVPILAIIYLAVKDAKSGTREITSRVIENYKTLDQQQRDNIQECRNNLVGATKAMHELELRMSEKIAKLDGTISEKDKQLKLMTDILANRNPELEIVLKEIRDFIKK